MKKDIEKLIPRAVEAIEQILLNSDEQVPKEYKGYAASLGPSIINSGLKPALAFYTDTHREKQDEREKVLRLKLLQAIYFTLENVEISDIKSDTLFREVLSPNQNELLWKNKIMNASIALKLALRTFKQTEE